MSGWDDEDDLDELLCDDDAPDNSNNNNGVETRVAAMFTEHEKIMDKEINQIQNEIVANNTNVEEQDVVAAQVENGDDWDFEDEDDIFNQDNDDLDFLEEAPMTTQAVPPPPSTDTAAVATTAEYYLPDKNKYSNLSPPTVAPPMENNDKFSGLENTEKNPFLQDSDDEEQVVVEQQHVTAIGNDVHEKVDNAIVSDQDDGGGDGWSDDDDLFEGDDFMESSPCVPKSSSPPPPPPPPVPTAPASSSRIMSPVANRTRSKTTTPGPPPIPTKQQSELNPSQQRIHQMLSTYTTNLTDTNYLSGLHYKLHAYQTKSHTTSTTSSSSKENTTAKASELRHYYAIRPKLRKYTLGVELKRMDYTLILENGSSTSDKDVIRSYFGVDDDGGLIMGGEEEEEEEEATVQELLIRSANQSLLADALAALTGSEEDIVMMCHDDVFFDNDGEKEERKSMGLILSGPTLCMSSVAETCQFTVDLQCGKVEVLSDLAISVPFHGDVAAIRELVVGGDDDDDEQLVDEIFGDGRVILARARVSVRFRPGGEGGNDNDEPTVQYAVQSVNPLLSSNSPVLRQVAIALAHDQEDPFFHEEQPADVGDATDLRDLFLLNQHLLSDSGLLAVSDHLERLRGAAEAKSTGFRSALRQLDGVTNVSGKLQFLKGSANAARSQSSASGSGFLGLGLALPSAEEIEAAEREAQNAVARQGATSFRFPRPDEVSDGLRFPRPDDVNEEYSRTFHDHNARPPPPPPPPPQPPLQGRPPTIDEEDITRPKPIIGGLLSRLAAAATLPSEREWGEEGGTGLTPPSSPRANHFVQAPTNDFPTLYRKEEDIKSMQDPGQGIGVKGVEQSLVEQSLSTPVATYSPGHAGKEFVAKDEVSGDAMLEDTVENDDDDGGWSDEDFDFEEPLSNDFVEDEDITNEKEEVEASMLPPSNNSSLAEVKEDVSNLQQDQHIEQPFEAKVDLHQSVSKPSTSFREQFSMVLQAKIESENKDMLQSGRLRRWTPLREDPIVRQKLMEVMRHNLIQN